MLRNPLNQMENEAEFKVEKLIITIFEKSSVTAFHFVVGMFLVFIVGVITASFKESRYTCDRCKRLEQKKIGYWYVYIWRSLDQPPPSVSEGNTAEHPSLSGYSFCECRCHSAATTVVHDAPKKRSFRSPRNDNRRRKQKASGMFSDKTHRVSTAKN